MATELCLLIPNCVMLGNYCVIRGGQPWFDSKWPLKHSFYDMAVFIMSSRSLYFNKTHYHNFSVPWSLNFQLISHLCQIFLTFFFQTSPSGTKSFLHYKELDVSNADPIFFLQYIFLHVAETPWTKFNRFFFCRNIKSVEKNQLFIMAFKDGENLLLLETFHLWEKKFFN